MAGRKLKYKAEASTIMEVVIAMVVIVAVFGIAMMIFSNVMRLSIPAKKITAQAVLQEAMINAERSRENLAKTYTLGNFRIEQKTALYGGDSRLVIIHLTAYDQNGQQTAVLNKVIIN